LTHDQIPHPGGAVVGTFLGIFGMAVNAVPNEFNVAYQVLGFSSALVITIINVYYWRELKRAQTAKAIADLSELSDDDRDSYVPPPRKGSNMREDQTNPPV
jgi:hypothetical protein